MCALKIFRTSDWEVIHLIWRRFWIFLLGAKRKGLKVSQPLFLCFWMWIAHSFITQSFRRCQPWKNILCVKYCVFYRAGPIVLVSWHFRHQFQKHQSTSESVLIVCWRNFSWWIFILMWHQLVAFSFAVKWKAERSKKNEERERKKGEKCIANNRIVKNPQWCSQPKE